MAALDNNDYRLGEQAFAKLIHAGKLFAALQEITLNGRPSELRRAGVMVDSLVFRNVVSASPDDRRILEVARRAAGVVLEGTLEGAWGAKPHFDPHRVQQRLNEHKITATG